MTVPLNDPACLALVAQLRKRAASRTQSLATDELRAAADVIESLVLLVRDLRTDLAIGPRVTMPARWVYVTMGTHAGHCAGCLGEPMSAGGPYPTRDEAVREAEADPAGLGVVVELYDVRRVTDAG